MKRFLLALFAVALAAQAGWAQLVPSKSVVEFSYVPARESHERGSSFPVLFRLRFKEGWHGQSHTPSMEGLVPTVIALAGTDKISPGRVIYPSGKMAKFSFSPEPLSVYEGDTYIGSSLAIAQDAPAGEHSVRATLTIQACNDKSCLAPSNVQISVPLKVSEPGKQGAPLNEDIYSANEGLFKQSAGDGASTGSKNQIEDYLAKHGLALTYLFVFIGGLALNLTPCVYPLIPVTVSYFGGQSEKKKGKLFVHALLYLLGMSAMYSSLGLFAALTGGLFGGALQHWAVVLLIAGVMAGLAFAMFGFYEIRMPSFLMDMGGKNREGLGGTFMMGLTVGIIAAPCIGPFVLGLLTFVGEKGDPVLGFTMFFALSLGLGLPFVALALFSGGLSSLPRSGVWMVWVKQVFGFIMLGMAIYFLEPLIPKTLYKPAIGVFIIGTGVFLGWISSVKAGGAGLKTAKWTLGVALIAMGGYIAYPAKSTSGPAIDWRAASSEAIAAAAGKPVIVDFSAEWCLPCKELDRFTFTDKRVIELSSGFIMLKADVTHGGDVRMDELKKRYNVAGVPTIVFIDSSGAEKPELRLTGFEEAELFVKRMESVSGR
ncbi:MAG: thioredoxin family protein [Nitrospinae bacterium]|nr:thioredoxin family protein [Nitrospinota bacterium]